MENMEKREKLLVVIKGAGDLASAVAHYLVFCGFSVIMTEQPFPTAVRRGVSFAQAVFDNEIVIEDIRGRLTESAAIAEVIKQNEVAVVIDPQASIIEKTAPDIVIDAIMAKRNLGTAINDAALVIGLGPGFIAGRDVHYCIETMRGRTLGRVIQEGSALPNTSEPGNIAGFTVQRVIRSPGAGIFRAQCQIGDQITEKQLIGHVDDYEVRALISGVLRGLIHEGAHCRYRMKLGDIDPRANRDYCWKISDKGIEIADGVLDAILREAKLGGTLFEKNQMVNNE